jgi:hypothetical protein
MPDVYQAGTLVPEIKGIVRGGVTVVLHRREEADGLLALCQLAGAPPEDPMHAIHRELSKSGLDSQAWLLWKRRLYSTRTQETTQGEQAPIDRLVDAITLAKEIWEKEGDGLALAVSIADPSTNAYPEFEVENAVPVLALRPGSLTAMILKGRFKALWFSVCLFAGGGATAYARSDNLVEKMRKEALANPNCIQLPVLRDVTANNLADDSRGDHKMLVVFVHGLLSTDAGHFDGLIKRLDVGPFVVAGFPHNTLAKIEINARELARDLNGAISDGPNPVGLVCHSRGGLVARMAAEYLYEEDQKKDQDFWRDRLRICVTFGTPHLGSDLAESPEEFIGTFAAQASLRATRQIASLLDLLIYSYEHDGFPGIEDLKPEGQFLRHLETQERGISPNIPIIAIGGRAPSGGTKSKFADRIFGTSEHDVVVRLKSSLPSFLPANHRVPTNCDHFGYFDETQHSILDSVVKVLRQAYTPTPEAKTSSPTMETLRFTTQSQ